MGNYDADRTLVQGARDVGRSMMPVDTKGLDKVIKAGTDMVIGVLDEKRKKAQEKVDANDAFTEAANEVELNSGALGEVLYNDTVDFAQTAKNDYLTALKNDDQKGMMAAKKAMQDRSQFTQQHKAFTTDLAKLQKDGDLSDAHTPEETAYMTAVLKGNYKVEKNEKGEMVFNVNGVKKTNAEFEDMHILKNYTMGKTIGELNVANKKNSTLDRNSVLSTISQSLPKTEKEFRAAMHDDLGGGASFKQLLETDTKLTDEILIGMGYDPNGDGVLDDDEKDKFIGAVTDYKNPNFNLEVSKKIMAEKMTQAVENNHTKHWEDQATAAKNKRINDRADAAYDNLLKENLEDKKSENAINEAKEKALIQNNILTTTTSSSTVESPDEFEVTDVNDEDASVTISKGTAIAVGEKIDDKDYKGLIFGSQGVYMKREGNKFEYFKGTRKEVEEQFRENNPYLDKIMNESISTSLEDAIKQYNSMSERKDLFKNMGGTGISKNEIQANEGVLEARDMVVTDIKTTNKVYTPPTKFDPNAIKLPVNG